MPVHQDVADLWRSVHSYPAPPTGFDALAADDRRLAEYGLPERWDGKNVPEYRAFRERMLGPTPDGTARRYLKIEQGGEFAPLGVRHFTGRPSMSHHREASSNWSGAYITPIPRPNRFLLVAGSWKVPRPELPNVAPSGEFPPDMEYRSSTWIGLGGHRSYNSLPQIGTSQYVTSAGGTPTITIGAWWQWWIKESPAHHRPNPICNFDVKVGDEILALILVEAPWPGDVHFVIGNQRTGDILPFKVRAPANIERLGSTAEWIHERPSDPVTKYRYPLPKCSPVEFTSCFAMNAEDFGAPFAWQALDKNSRLISMTETFANPHRSALVSLPRRVSRTSIEVTYSEAG